ncbi:hypothetical protein GCM10010383_30420 [Streptomyces lomondensis]|uniref:Uncharacterized protein n=1 Tax=Streptomyces lomondensis TaxID=68229 RepID=A0ABQ2X3Z1_9ACTN|nr:hypothetical protein GCM10010383_30420 [Streptomyces lomondensis]
MPGEQDAGEFHAPALAAGQRAERPVRQLRRQAETGGDPGGLRLGRVAAARLELGLGTHIGVHRALGPVGHGGLCTAQRPYGPVEAPRGQDPVGDGDRLVGRPRVLREMADVAGAHDGPGGGPQGARQGVQQSRLSRAVAADQADAVAGGDVEGDAGQQQTRAHAHVDVTNGDHEKTLRTSKRTHGWRGSGSSARKFGA